MEKKILDLEKLTDKELLVEFADRVLAYDNSLCKLNEWKEENNYDDECEFNFEYEELKLDHDDDFCRLREIVRFVKKDDTIWTC